MHPRLKSILPWLAIALIVLGAWQFWPGGDAPSPSPLDPAVLAAALSKADGARAESASSGDDATPAADDAESDAEWQPRLPRDLGAHPDAAAELWDLTGALEDATGARYGLRLTLIRLGLLGGDLPDGSGAARSASLAANALLLGRAALIPASGEPTYAERASRVAAGLAGVAGEPARVWIEDWELISSDGEGGGQLRISMQDRTLELTLTSVKPVLTPAAALLTNDQRGGAGAPGPRWLSQPRIGLGGRLHGPGGTRNLEGTGWLDHAWGDDATAAGGLGGGGRGQLALNRFLLQLDDDTELLCIQLRRRAGGGTAVPTCLLNPRAGEPEVLRRRALSLTPKEGSWHSARSGAEYPLHWRLIAPALGLELDIDALRPDQELLLAEPAWSGAVTARGSRDGSPVIATGRMDLSGYAPGQGR
jgi:predicted secreted hydrolase